MTDQQKVLIEIQEAFVRLDSNQDTIEESELLKKLRNLAEVAVMNGCSRPQAMEVWRKQ